MIPIISVFASNYEIHGKSGVQLRQENSAARGIDHGASDVCSLVRSNEADFPERATRDFTGVNSNRAEASIGARSRQDKWPCARSTSKPALFSQLCGVSIDSSVHLSSGTTWLMDHTRVVRAFARLPPDYRSSATADFARLEIWYQSALLKRGSLAPSRFIIVYRHSRKDWFETYL